MKVVIIEDEALAAERLEELILEIRPETDILATLDSVKQSVEWLASHNPDLIFLDIKLSDGLSFAIFEKIDINVPVIFTTAYDEYAIKAFELNSIDYLLKPVREKDLRAGIEKLENLRKTMLPDIPALLESLANSKPEYKKRFLLQYGEKLKKIEVNDIAYFYAQDKVVYLTTFDKQTFPMDHSLNQLEELIDPEQFFRINRQMLISYPSIQQMYAYSRSRIKIDLNPPAPKGIKPLVSIHRTPVFREWIDK
jgi:DNA-binding LytR/AlgR family response regulator